MVPLFLSAQIQFRSFSHAIIRIVLTVSTLAPTFSNAGTSSTKKRFENAAAVHAMASVLRSGIIPSELRKALLESSRAEDKEFAKSVIVNWKAYNDTNMYTEFDELIIADDDGTETLRMKPLETSGEFEINGRAWSVPTTGSISKSLRMHLDSQAEDSALRSSPTKSVVKFLAFVVPSAFGTPSNRDALRPAFLLSWDSRGSTPKEALLKSSEALNANPPTKFVVNENRMSDFLTSVLNVKVQCRDGSAKGFAKIHTDRFAFESRSDGSVIYTMSNEQKTKLLVTAKVVDQRQIAAERLAKLAAFKKSPTETVAKQIFQDFMARTIAIDGSDRLHRRTGQALRTTLPKLARNGKYLDAVNPHTSQLKEFYESRARVVASVSTSVCVVPDCSKTEDKKRSTIQPWLSRHDQQHIENALKWKPQTTPNSLARIVRYETEDLPVFAVEPIYSKLSPADDDRAKRMIIEARRAAERSDEIVRNMMLSVRPLGACCEESACRTSLLKQNVELVPDSSRPVKK